MQRITMQEQISLQELNLELQINWENGALFKIAVIKDKNGYESFGTGPAFPVPDKYVKEIIDTDLGIVMDKIFNGNGLKNEKGGIAHLTKDVVTRYDLTREAFIMALTEFKNGDIWRDQKYYIRLVLDL